MKRRLLAIAWAYPGASGPATDALARRVGQVVRGFQQRGWDVCVVHRSHDAVESSCSTIAADEGSVLGTLERLSVPGAGMETWRAGASLLTPLRVTSTAWYAVTAGDRSARWARGARHVIAERADSHRPDLVIAFFTPRAPLALAARAHRRWNIPWIADLQDPVLEGCSPHLRPVVGRWMRRTLRSAAVVVQVSPEWGRTDAALLGRPVEVLRHAVPLAPTRRKVRITSSSRSDLVLLYAGSIAPEQQRPSPLVAAIEELNAARLARGLRGVELRVAGTEASFNTFRSCVRSENAWLAIRYAGWLTHDALIEEMRAADALVLVPWATADRVVIPSKLFEYASIGAPILIAGPDSGALASLYREWGHPNVTSSTAGQIQAVLERALQGDFSGLLQPWAAASRPLDEDDLVAQYCDWADFATREL